MKLDSQILSYSSSKLSKKSEYSEEGVRNKDRNTIEIGRVFQNKRTFRVSTRKNAL